MDWTVGNDTCTRILRILNSANMKQILKIVVILTINLCGLYNNVSAQFEVTTRPAVSETPTGAIYVVADGNAGPFDIEFYSADDLDSPLKEIESEIGAFSLEDIGAGSYVVIIIDRYDCETEYDIIVEEEECDIEIYLEEITHPDASAAGKVSFLASIVDERGVGNFDSALLVMLSSICIYA